MNLTVIDAWELVAIGALVIVLFVGLLGLSLRITHIETRLAEGPSHADLAGIRDRIAEMSGHMSAMADRQSESTRAIQTIQKHLMEADT